jgi:hypothetical protein
LGLLGETAMPILPTKVVVGQAAGQLLPGIAAIGGFVQTAAGQIRRRVDRPWRTPRRPTARRREPRVLRVDGEVDGADVVRVVGLEQDLLPGLAAVQRAIDAALGIGIVDDIQPLSSITVILYQVSYISRP